MGFIIGALVGAACMFVVSRVQLRTVRRQLADAEAVSLRYGKADSDVKSILASAQLAATQMLEHARSVLISSDERARARLEEAELQYFETRPTEAPRAPF